MDTFKASEIKKSIQILSDFLQIDDLVLIGLICFGGKVSFRKFKEVSDVWNEFENKTERVW